MPEHRKPGEGDRPEDVRRPDEPRAADEAARHGERQPGAEPRSDARLDALDERALDVDLEAVDAAAMRGHALDFPRTRISDLIDGLVGAFHYVINWIWVILVLLIVINVVLRYLIGTSMIWMEELQWHLYAAGWMIGLAYALKLDGHVRVDVLADRLSARARAWIELFGLVLLVLPLCYIMLTYGWPFVLRSWQLNEVSAAPGGLPYRWIIKSVILVAFALLALAALSRLLRVTAFLFGLPRPRPA
jgi:TRAP-type mannitol/chloroaromatic compound transport system permease small subunit